MLCRRRGDDETILEGCRHRETRRFFAVTLDRRSLKTSSGNTLLLPGNKKLVATLVATEWDNQDKLLKPHALPIVSQLFDTVSRI